MWEKINRKIHAKGLLIKLHFNSFYDYIFFPTVSVMVSLHIFLRLLILMLTSLLPPSPTTSNSERLLHVIASTVQCTVLTWHVLYRTFNKCIAHACLMNTFIFKWYNNSSFLSHRVIRYTCYYNFCSEVDM